MDQPDLTSLEEAARVELDDKFAARERALSLSRKVIRSSANAIRSLHRGDLAESERLMDEASAMVAEAADVVAEHGDVRYAGFVDDAAKEYAEARTSYALALG
ncbi:MAG: translin family protein, partial [Acidimicrobiia bacterium]|nr:translin family protein [Acidimicrobiia bacterium]